MIKILRLFTLFLALLPIPPVAHASPAEESFQAERPFHGSIKKDSAKTAALVAAEQAAMQKAMRILAQDKDFRFISETLSPAAIPPIEGLAAKVFSIRERGFCVKGFMPDMRAGAEVSLIPPVDMRTTLLEAWEDPEALELSALLLARKAALLEFYDLIYPDLLNVMPKGNEENPLAIKIDSIIGNLESLDALQKMLPDYSEGWGNPEKAYMLLRECVKKGHEDPLLLIFLAKAALQFDRPAEALEYAQAAVKLSPEVAIAHDTEGLILLRQYLPSLALESFNKAIISADKPRYRVHRASAFLALQKRDEMCSDLYAACADGDCEGYEWGIREGYCEQKKLPSVEKEAP